MDSDRQPAINVKENRKCLVGEETGDLVWKLISILIKVRAYTLYVITHPELWTSQGLKLLAS